MFSMLGKFVLVVGVLTGGKLEVNEYDFNPPMSYEQCVEQQKLWIKKAEKMEPGMFWRGEFMAVCKPK